jgi:hypothetical protein
MPRTRQKDEIICWCSAYDHPHRLGGGSCNGSEWCASYRSIDSFECDTCNHNDNNQCDIVTGQDELNNETCECVANEIRTGALADEYGGLPLDSESYWERKQREYYDC